MTTPNTEIVSALPLDADTAHAIEALVRTAQAGVKHRLILEFKMRDNRLGVAASLERKTPGRWTATRTATWIPLHAYGTPLLHLLLYIAEHGRVPEPTSPPGAPPNE